MKKSPLAFAQPTEPDRASAFLNIRVADIAAAYADPKDAQFLTEPKDYGGEIRAYIRAPMVTLSRSARLK